MIFVSVGINMIFVHILRQSRYMMRYQYKSTRINKLMQVQIETKQDGKDRGRPDLGLVQFKF